jgi:transposase
MEAFENEFKDWLAKIQPELKRIFAVLQQKLKDEPTELMEDLRVAESWYARVSYILAQSNSFLDRASFIYLPGKEEVNRELERKVLLDSLCAPIREMRDKIEGLQKSLLTRISLGQSLLKWYTVNAERGPAQK